MSDRKRRQLEELAALAATGVLSDDEAAEARRRLDSVEGADRIAIDAITETAGLLGLDAPAVVPPDGLKERVLARIGAERKAKRPRPALEGDGILIWRAADLEWKPAFDGVWVKRLNVNRETGMVTQLLRIEPGAVVPPHRHGGEEEVVLLSGDFEVHGIPMQPGDYCRADAGSLHQPGRTKDGAVVLVRTSLHNEYLVS